MTILELREARNKAWEGAKAFVESKRDKDGLLSKEDAETWMDANSAIELGFADEIMQRNTEEDELEVPNVSMTFSRASVTNSLIEKMAEKCKITQKAKNKIASDSLLERLELIRNWR